MRFLLAAVLALPEKPSAKELQKVHTTSAWIHERISGLPEDAPASRRPSAAGPTPKRDSTASTESREDHPSRGHPHSNLQQPQHQNQPHPGRRPSSTPAPTPTPGPQTYSQPQAPPVAYSPATTSAPGQAQAPDPDPIYQATRLAALLYTHAISRRQPFSATVTAAQFHQLWATAWRVPLSTWRSLLGVLNWYVRLFVSTSLLFCWLCPSFYWHVYYICLLVPLLGCLSHPPSKLPLSPPRLWHWWGVDSGVVHCIPSRSRGGLNLTCPSLLPPSRMTPSLHARPD
jgi:hypothetical protein